MRRLILIVTLMLVLVTVCGCDYVAPGVEKSKTEKKQLTAMERQVAALERIANALDTMVAQQDYASKLPQED